MAGAGAADPPAALVVVESMFGNTRAIADAVAAGLSAHLPTQIVDVAEAPAVPGTEVRLLVVGGPTHAFSMSRTSTRENAVERGANVTGPIEVGLREWLDNLDRIPTGVHVAAFDTKVRKPHVPGSAAHAAARRLRRRGARVSVSPETFYVTDTKGPLEPGERERAQAWGADLAALAQAPSPAR